MSFRLVESYDDSEATLLVGGRPYPLSFPPAHEEANRSFLTPAVLFSSAHM